jgi:uncharacterized membrane protein
LEIRTRDISLVAIFSALYVALVIVFAPFSFYAIQFRIAGVIRPGIAKKQILAVGYGIGVLVANFFSPFAGFHELLFMPLMSFIAGMLGYYAAKPFENNYFVTGVVIAVVIPLSVSWMLNQLFGLPILATLPGLVISEQIINGIGSVLFRLVESRYEWWNY